MNRSILHAKSNYSFTFSIFHEQVQGKVLHKVAGVISQWLERRKKNKKKTHPVKLNHTYIILQMNQVRDEGEKELTRP